MALIDVENVTVEIPLFDSHSTSLKRWIAAAMGKRDNRHDAQCEQRTVRALDDISLRLVDGDRIGLIGKNGSGKTTLLRVLAGIYEPAVGQVRVDGRTTTVLDQAFGIDMEASGTENIYLRGYALGMSKRMIKSVESEIAEFTELGRRLVHPVRTYSTGMMLRLAFSISLMSPHEILLIDEIIGAGDASFVEKTREKLRSTLAQSRIVVVASHSLELIESMCNKAIYLRDGRLNKFGPVMDVVSAFRRDASSTPA